jgi:site-specific DNA-methyltransferase (adenine-specific)
MNNIEKNILAEYDHNFIVSKNNFILINDDCENVLSKIPDSSIDLILTDPPYNINYAEWDYFNNIKNVSSEWHRILKDDGSLFVFAGWSFVCNLISSFDTRFKLNDWIIYDRIKGRGAKKRLVSTREDLLWYTKTNEWTFNKSKAYSTIKKKTGGLGAKNGQENRALSNVWTDISPLVPWSKEKVNHPTQKPMQISDRIIDVFTKENSTILDCYMGSGTFGCSSIIKNHYFIGIEKDVTFFNIAKERISNI